MERKTDIYKWCDSVYYTILCEIERIFIDCDKDINDISMYMDNVLVNFTLDGDAYNNAELLKRLYMLEHFSNSGHEKHISRHFNIKTMEFIGDMVIVISCSNVIKADTFRNRHKN